MVMTAVLPTDVIPFGALMFVFLTCRGVQNELHMAVGGHNE